MNKWLEIGDQFTKEGLSKLKPKQVLVFDMEGSRTEFKIERISLKNHKLFVTETKLYKESEVNIVDKETL